MEQKLLGYFRDHEAEIFADLKRLVLAEASTSDLKELAECRDLLTELIRERTGLEPVIHPGKTGHDCIQFEMGEGEEKILLIGHYDTVHTIGALKYYVEGNRLYGPGVSDMKSGLISAIWTAKAYRELGIDPGKRLVFLFNGDEETGSHDSNERICSLAEGAKAALVCEPCVSNGNLKTGRKGNQGFHVTIHGKASHAGNAHQAGINALEEMAHEILFIQSLTDYEAGTTVNVGVASGGTKRNVVPALAQFDVDCRFRTAAEGKRIRDAVCGLSVTVPGSSREVVVNEGKPPMEESEGNMALYALALRCGEKLGISFSHEFVGGGSDGNAVSAMGIPTLDGLGAVGDGAHSANEYLFIDQYIPRIALLASLIPEI